MPCNKMITIVPDFDHEFELIQIVLRHKGAHTAHVKVFTTEEVHYSTVSTVFIYIYITIIIKMHNKSFFKFV